LKKGGGFLPRTVQRWGGCPQNRRKVGGWDEKKRQPLDQEEMVIGPGKAKGCGHFRGGKVKVDHLSHKGRKEKGKRRQKRQREVFQEGFSGLGQGVEVLQNQSNAARLEKGIFERRNKGRQSGLCDAAQKTFDLIRTRWYKHEKLQRSSNPLWNRKKRSHAVRKRRLAHCNKRGAV